MRRRHSSSRNVWRGTNRPLLMRDLASSPTFCERRCVLVRGSFSFPNPATCCRRGCLTCSSKIPLALPCEWQGSAAACFCPRTPHVAMVLSSSSPIPAARRWHYRGIRFDASHVAFRVGASDRSRVVELQQRVWNGDGRQRADTLGKFRVRTPTGFRRRPIVGSPRTIGVEYERRRLGIRVWRTIAHGSLHGVTR